MKAPIHCGTSAKPYTKLYGRKGKRPHSIEYGFRCAVCGTIRLPHETDENGFQRWREESDKLREKVIQED